MRMASDPRPRWNEAHVGARLRESGFDPGDAPLPVSWFGDDEVTARELGLLVVEGKKRATAGLQWRWQHDSERLPRAGDRQIIIDWSGEPLAVIELTDVSVMPYHEVSEEFAREEGEGDLSLEYWRDVHWRFFSRECARLGRKPYPRMPVVCMRFRLVHAVRP